MPETRTIYPDPWSIFDTPKIYWQFGKPPPLPVNHQNNSSDQLKYPHPSSRHPWDGFFQAFDPPIRRLYQALERFETSRFTWAFVDGDFWSRFWSRKSWDICPPRQLKHVWLENHHLKKRLVFPVSGCCFLGCRFCLLLAMGFWGIFCWKFHGTWGTGSPIWGANFQKAVSAIT